MKLDTNCCSGTTSLRYGYTFIRANIYASHLCQHCGMFLWKLSRMFACSFFFFFCIASNVSEVSCTFSFFQYLHHLYQMTCRQICLCWNAVVVNIMSSSELLSREWKSGTFFVHIMHHDWHIVCCKITPVPFYVWHTLFRWRGQLNAFSRLHVWRSHGQARGKCVEMNLCILKHVHCL